MCYLVLFETSRETKKLSTSLCLLILSWTSSKERLLYDCMFLYLVLSDIIPRFDIRCLTSSYLALDPSVRLGTSPVPSFVFPYVS